MKNYLFALLLCILLVACTEETKDDAPPNLLPFDKMVAVTVDVQLLEATFAARQLPYDTAMFLYNNYRKDLQRKHHLDDSTYQRSFKYYAARPKLMAQIYERVVDSLSLLEGQKKF